MAELAGIFKGEEIYWIPGFDFRYAITKSGKVASAMIGNNHFTGWLTSRVLHTGYVQIGLCDPLRGKQCGFYVHRLVATTFLDLVLKDLDIQVDHINKSKLDNNLSNLRLCNQIQNVRWSKGIGELDTDECKECRRCHKIKFRTEFYVNNCNEDKTGSYCKLCHDILHKGVAKCL